MWVKTPYEESTRKALRGEEWRPGCYRRMRRPDLCAKMKFGSISSIFFGHEKLLELGLWKGPGDKDGQRQDGAVEDYPESVLLEEY